MATGRTGELGYANVLEQTPWSLAYKRNKNEQSTSELESLLVAKFLQMSKLSR